MYEAATLREIIVWTEAKKGSSPIIETLLFAYGGTLQYFNYTSRNADSDLGLKNGIPLPTNQAY